MYNNKLHKVGAKIRREVKALESITSRSNERVKQIAGLCESAARRQIAGLCVLHGAKLCGEAARLGATIAELWATEEAQQKYAADYSLLAAKAGKTVRMSQSVCEKLSGQKSPQGILGLVRLPAVQPLGGAFDQNGPLPRRLLVMDAVQDPANVGAMLRTAAALGYGGAVLGQGCADPFSPKALRASMGAAFALPLYGGGEGGQTAAILHEQGFFTVATALNPCALPVTRLPRDGALALFIGNEGNGLSAQTVASCDQAAIIPITGLVESLNAAAAAAIAMWELRP